MGLFTKKCGFCGSKEKRSTVCCSGCGMDMRKAREPEVFTLADLIQSPLVRVRKIESQLFCTFEQVQDMLGRSADEIKQFAREGRLREFRDGARTLFKAEQVSRLRGAIDPAVCGV